MGDVDPLVIRNLRLGAGVLLVLAGVVPPGACAKAPVLPPQPAQQAQAVATPTGPPPLDPLPVAVQGILRQRMTLHARDMNALVGAIMIVDYPNIAERADQIADDVSLSRPLSDDATELNSLVPEKFFEYQDQLRAEARKLAEAARARNPREVASRYGRLSESCVRCHAQYRPRS